MKKLGGGAVMINMTKKQLMESAKNAYRELVDVINKYGHSHKEWFSVNDESFYDFDDTGDGFFKFWLKGLDEFIQKYVLEIFMLDKKVEYHQHGTFTSFFFSKEHMLTDDEISFIEIFMNYSDLVREVTFNSKDKTYTDWQTLKELAFRKKNNILEMAITKSDNTFIFGEIGCLDGLLDDMDLLSLFKKKFSVIFNNAYEISELHSYQIDEDILEDILEDWNEGIEKVAISKKQHLRDEYDVIKNYSIDKDTFKKIEEEISQLQQECESGLKKAIKMIEYYLVGNVPEGDFPFMVYENLPKLFEEFVTGLSQYSATGIKGILERSKGKVKEAHEDSCSYGNYLMKLSNLQVASIRDRIREEEYGKVEGLNFSIISNNLINHLVYIAQNESKIARLTQKAEKDWQDRVYGMAMSYKRNDEQREADYARNVTAPNLINVAIDFYVSISNLCSRNIYYTSVYWLMHPEKSEEVKQYNFTIDMLLKKIATKQQELQYVLDEQRKNDEEIYGVRRKISERKDIINSLAKKWFGKKKAQEKISIIELEISALEKKIEQLMSQKENNRVIEQEIKVVIATLKKERDLNREGVNNLQAEIEAILEAYN